MKLRLVFKLAAVTLTAVCAGFILFHNQFVTKTAAMLDGATIYAQKCAVCHGDDGKANTPRGKRKGATDLTKSKIGTAAGIAVITRGRDLMPAYGDELSETEIALVMAYVRGFRGR